MVNPSWRDRLPTLSLRLTADAFVQCRVTAEIKTLVRALAKREQVTASALIKQLLQVVLRSSAAAGFPRLEEPQRSSRDMRLYVRLNPNDRLLLRQRAAARGMPAATYESRSPRSFGVMPSRHELGKAHLYGDFRTGDSAG